MDDTHGPDGGGATAGPPPRGQGVAWAVVRARVPLALAVLAVLVLNRLTLFQVALPGDWQYLLWGWLPAADGTLVDPLRAPWLVLSLVALVAWVARPGVVSWTAVVVTFLLPHFVEYRAGPILLWEPHLLDPGNAGLLHAPALLLLVVLALLVVGRPAGGPSGDRRRPPAPRP